ncbi:MAG: anti-sigma factor domain-containing protein [Clostridium sp.]|uniref:anti-sigma factor domain-containing protein n=1 Tax=Clostridium sp. TaxID=1506 RepID=UPI003F3DF3D9
MELFDRSKYKFSSMPSLFEVSEEANRVRGEQISLMTKELYLYKVIIKDLFAIEQTFKDRDLILNIAFYIIEQPELIEYFQEKRKLPINILSKHTMQSKVFLEKYSDYIITYAIIFSNPNYKLIQDYMRIDKKEEEENKEEEEKNIVPFNNGNNKEDKGIVLKKLKHTACILTSMGEFKKLKVSEDFEVGEEITGSIKKGFREYKIHIIIAAAIIVLVVGGFFFKYTAVDRTVLIKTTSQIKLGINSFGKVVDAYSPTTKGEEMLDNIKINNVTLDTAIKDILVYSENNDMLPEGAILVTVTGEPIKYGTLDETGKYVNENNIRLIINNAGNEQKLLDNSKN